jgi:hypothetical protein
MQIFEEKKEKTMTQVIREMIYIIEIIFLLNRSVLSGADQVIRLKKYLSNRRKLTSKHPSYVTEQR